MRCDQHRWLARIDASDARRREERAAVWAETVEFEVPVQQLDINLERVSR
jgi:hypothetical protein